MSLRPLFFVERRSDTLQGPITQRKAFTYTRVYPKVSGLAAWSENCKWYSSVPLSAVVSQSSEFCRYNTLWWSVVDVVIYVFIDSVRKHLDTPS
jgi:hypothetical protein